MDRPTAQRAARLLMEEHGVGHLRFEWMKSTRVFGQCRFTRTYNFETRDYKITPIMIRLSGPLTDVNDWTRVRETVLHEIAHALDGIRNNAHGHGPSWKRIARELGLSGDRCYSLDDTEQVKLAWTGTCVNGHTVYKAKRPTRSLGCSRCSKRFDPRFVFTWTRTGDVSTPVPTPQPRPEPVMVLRVAAAKPATPNAKKVLADLRWRARHALDYAGHTVYTTDGGAYECEWVTVSFDNLEVTLHSNASSANPVMTRTVQVADVTRISSRKAK